jgi:hypothetical protein
LCKESVPNKVSTSDAETNREKKEAKKVAITGRNKERRETGRKRMKEKHGKD